MRKALALYSNIIFLLFAANAWGQTNGLNSDSLRAKMLLYSKINASGLLFVHTDKTLYTNNEAIWFSGYLINRGPGKMDDHTLLSVSLMRENDRKVICEQRNVMERGLGNGSLLIPDNTPPGNYIFNAYTNVIDQHGKPTALFSQPVTIKSITKRSFAATLHLLDTVVTNGLVKANVILDLKDQKRLNKPTITYGIIGGKKQKITLTEKESIANIILAASQLTGIEPVLLVEAAFNYDTIYLSIKLPKIQPKGLNIRFMPEGGNLSDGLESVVAIETTTNGLQVSLTGVLFSNDKPIDTISTNSYGVGRFKLKPDIKNRYTFRVKANSYLKRDSIYQLPDVVDNGLALRFNEAVINDTLVMTLYSKVQKKVQVVIHNYQETFSLFTTTTYPQGKRLSLVVSNLPKGLATITIADEQGKPLAERIFFAHYNLQTIVTITPNKSRYGKRDSVAVVVNLKDQYGSPVRGLLSVAAVQENRLESAKRQYIDNYVFVKHELGDLPRDIFGRGYNNKNFLEDMLLTRGWRRYTWQNLLAAKGTDTLKMAPALQFEGKVLYYGNALKKPLKVLTIPNFASITTNADGTFVLQQKHIEVSEGKKILLWLGENKELGYEIKTSNPYNVINHKISEDMLITSGGIAEGVQNSEDQLSNSFEGNTMLKMAHIKANKTDHDLFGTAKGLVNDCGDYVCKTGFLNCFFDPPYSLPVAGVRYRRISETGKSLPSVIYAGCIDKTNGYRSDAVYTAREFYGLNREADAVLEPQYLSTLFWKPGIETDENGKASFSFFTGDIEGRFNIVSQGVGLDGVFYGESEFSVK